MAAAVERLDRLEQAALSVSDVPELSSYTLNFEPFDGLRAGPELGTAATLQRFERSGSDVAVGIALAGDPSHRSGRAGLPHPALALGRDADVAEK